MRKSKKITITVEQLRQIIREEAMKLGKVMSTDDVEVETGAWEDLKHRKKLKESYIRLVRRAKYHKRALNECRKRLAEIREKLG